MRVFALSDIDIDYDVNAKWIANPSIAEYEDDVLILAGDATDTRRLLAWCLSTLLKRFKKVLFVPETTTALFAAHRFAAGVHSERKQASISYPGLRAAGAPVAQAQLEQSCVRT
jgi:hypothetical protein